MEKEKKQTRSAGFEPWDEDTQPGEDMPALTGSSPLEARTKHNIRSVLVQSGLPQRRWLYVLDQLLHETVRGLENTKKK